MATFDSSSRLPAVSAGRASTRSICSWSSTSRAPRETNSRCSRTRSMRFWADCSTPPASTAWACPSKCEPGDPVQPCPPGRQRDFEPVLDIHIGVITTSLGGRGGKCAPCPRRIAKHTWSPMAFRAIGIGGITPGIRRSSSSHRASTSRAASRRNLSTILDGLGAVGWATKRRSKPGTGSSSSPSPTTPSRW